MTSAEMAALHAAAFPGARGWSAAEIACLVDGPGAYAVAQARGFALGRAITGEAELITIAVDPHTHRQGIGRTLLAAFETGAQARGAEIAFLEVAADNGAALALYRNARWRETGRRRGYYPRRGGAVDAVTMTKTLPSG